MNAAWFHRIVLCLFVGTLALMTISGFLVSASTGLVVPPWAAAFGQFEHRLVAGVVLALALASLVLAVRLQDNPAPRRLSASVVMAMLAQAGLGMAMASLGPSAWLGIAQAMLMHLMFTLVTVLLLISGPAGKREVMRVADEFRPSLRGMAWLPAMLIAAQIVLGSAYRHGLVGVLPHLVGALLVAGLLALVGLLVATTYPHHRPLKHSAMALVWLMLVQVVMGVVALGYRAIARSGSATWDANFVVVTVGHVLVGSFTLAACVWLALTIRKHVGDVTVAPGASLTQEIL